MLPHHGRYDYSPIISRTDYDWPDGKRLAFYLALNIEHFAFGSSMGHIPVPARLDPQPDVRSYAWRDYGLRVAIWRIFDILDELEMPACHLVNSMVCEHYPEIIDKIRERGDEVVAHGRTNAERQGVLFENDEAALIREATETLASHVGKRPEGWMGPWRSESMVTSDLLKEAGYTYTMDWPCDDQAIWLRTRSGPLLSIPYPVEINDGPMILGKYHTPAEMAQMTIDQFEQMLLDAEKQPLIFPISIHTFIVGHPFRRLHLRKALEHIARHRDRDKVWFTVPSDIARHAMALPSGVVPGS
jgi:allantoinase